MALLKCTECENMISEYATACPYCGCPMSIILEKIKTEKDNAIIEKKVTIKSVNDFVKYRSLCKVPEEIIERITFLSEEEERLKKLYDEAVEMMNSAKTESQFQEVGKLFENIHGYRNSASLVTCCHEFAENARKDAAEQASSCQRMTTQIKEKEETERLEKEHQEELACKKVEAKRSKKIKKIAVACGVVVVGLAMLVKNVIFPGMKENDALEENYVQTEESVNEQEKIELLKSAEIGDVVYFGTYEQDNNFINGKEEIEWRVLAKEEGRILLLSEYALDCKPYHETSEDITWEECTLRSWLNEEFFDVAFSDEEEKMIPTVIVSAEKNPEYDTNSGNATEDKIFLLSVMAAYHYVASGLQMECKPTEYANARGVYKNSDNGCVWWWLRTAGRYQDYATGVGSNDGISESGNDVHYGIYAVRPAMWLELNS